MREIISPAILLVLVLSFTACQNQDANKAQTNQTAGRNANAASNQAAGTASSKGLKPPAPCGLLEKSLQMKAGEYKAIDETSYYCQQTKLLVNYSGFEYRALGNSSEIKELYLALNLSTRNNEKQNADLHKLLALAAAELLEAATVQKLPDEVMTAILSDETKEFTLPTDGANAGKPQIKSISVEHLTRNEAQQKASGFQYVKHVTMKF
jgi:hypothetical protein